MITLYFDHEKARREIQKWNKTKDPMFFDTGEWIDAIPDGAPIMFHEIFGDSKFFDYVVRREWCRETQ